MSIWKAPRITNAKIAQTFKFSYAQYIDNHRNNILWPATQPKLKMHTMPNKVIDSWPYLLSTCSNEHIKGLYIARHNNVVHYIIRTLQSNKHTRSYSFVNVGNQNSRPQNTRLATTMHMQYPHPCTCIVKLRPCILCVLGAPTNNQPLLTLTPHDVL